MAYPDSHGHSEAAFFPELSLTSGITQVLHSSADSSPPPLPLHPPSTHLFRLSHWPFLEDSMSNSPLPPFILGILFSVSFSAYISLLFHASVFSIRILEWQYRVKNAGSVPARRNHPSLTEEWISNMWWIYHTRECSSPRKRNEEPHSCHNIDEPWKYWAVWKKPDMKGMLIWFHLHVMSGIGKSKETEMRWVVARG